MSASIHRTLIGTTALTAACVFAPLSAEANPKGGTVVGGQATISQAPGRTTINQKSKKAIINWQGFDIDRGEVTSFIQPGRNAIALNRVDGKKRSLINGGLEANGHVWVVNPSGVVFGPNAKVDVHGIVATTSDILDSDFMSGNYAFSIPSTDPDASVVNQGTITIGEVGLAGLVAPHVRNEGLIVGTLGQVVLAGASTFTLDFHGDGLIQFAAGEEVLSAIDPNRALVENAGTIRADGGRVLLTADVAAGVVNEVINTSGVIEARSVSQNRGVIVLHGGSEGIVTVSGQLGATGIDAGTVGGEVDIRGEKVLIAGGARIDASGHSGGGVVRVGGDLGGSGDGDTARQTIIAPGATIAVDATSVGDGGEVVAWADDRLDYAGSISARGGPDGGDGGTVETSSLGSLASTGTVDTGAVNGEVGQWLLDPGTVRIVDGTGTHEVPVHDHAPPDGEATVSAQSIAQATSDIIIAATNDIIVDVPFSAQNNVYLQAPTVEIKASIETPGTVIINAKFISSDDGAVIVAPRLIIFGSSTAGSQEIDGNVDINTAISELAVGQASDGFQRYGDVVINNEGDLTVSKRNGTGIAAGALQLTVEGVLTLEGAINTDAQGDAIVVVTDRLINNAGPDALETPNGRALIYSVEPNNDTLAGIPAAIVFMSSFETTPPEQVPDIGNVIFYQAPDPTQIPDIGNEISLEAPEAPEFPKLTSKEVNVITEPVVISSSELSQSETTTLAAPAPTVFAIPPALDPAGSQDLLFSNDGNYELWGLSGTQ